MRLQRPQPFQKPSDHAKYKGLKSWSWEHLVLGLRVDVLLKLGGLGVEGFLNILAQTKRILPHAPRRVQGIACPGIQVAHARELGRGRNVNKFTSGAPFSPKTILIITRIMLLVMLITATVLSTTTAVTMRIPVTQRGNTY